MPIRLLSEHVAAQIAAGEVIERPASVVKELLENALDAGAGRVEIALAGSGIDLIRLSDNGMGIPADEVALALIRHATSKLHQIQDLDHLQTLGFRGEALASIAAISQLTLRSRHEGAEQGWELQCQGSQILSQNPVGMALGTTLEIRNLFYNVPARRKFLKSDATERRHISQLVIRYAMAYPQVRFILIEEGLETFRSTGNGDLGEVVLAAFGGETFRQMLAIRAPSGPRADPFPLRIWGYTSDPSHHRANRNQIVLFLNGRHIQDQRLSYAIVQAYHTHIPQGRYPSTVLMLEVPPAEVDVNVHPTKAEVRFRAPDVIFGAVLRAIRDSLGEDDLRVREVRAGDYFPDTPAPPNWQPSPGQFAMPIDTPDPGRRANQQAPDAEEEAEILRPSAASRDLPPLPDRPRSLPPMRVVGQIAATYIIAEGPVGMYLIDQHAAHERILYERFMARQENREAFRQHTLATSLLDLPPVPARLLHEQLPLLQDLGFDVEAFGAHSFRIRAVPSLLADHDPGEVLKRILQELESGAGSKAGAGDIEAKIVRQICKTAAVKAGQGLSYEEMQGILRQLERCEVPLTCPHGRPTLIHISASDLAREFGRS
jgi:DNA mismatch repair protein MutL